MTYPASWFKRPEDKERAESDGVGIEDMEDQDLTPEGLAAKKAAWEEGHIENRNSLQIDSKTFTLGQELNNSIDNRWPVDLNCSFIEPGLVNYEYLGNSGETVYVRKEVLDAMMPSLKHKPVINEEHRDVEPDGYKQGLFDGKVDSVWFDPADAQFHLAGAVWDESTKKNLRNGYKVSVAYNVTKWGPGGIHNNVPYDREVLAGEYTHLAIVANPRYEGVKVYNSGGIMRLKFWTKETKEGKTIETPQEFETKKAVVLVNGIERPLDAAIAALEEQTKTVIANDQEVTLANGKKVLGKDLVAALMNQEEKEKKEKEDKELEAKNAAEAEEKAKKEEAENQLRASMESDHKDGKHDDKELDGCGMCNSAKELKNAHTKHTDDAPGKDCVLCNRAKFEKVRKLANNRPAGLPGYTEPFDGFAAATAKYGSTPPPAKA